MSLSLFDFRSESIRTLLIVAFYMQKNVHWRVELGDYRPYVTLALTLPYPKNNPPKIIHAS